SAQRIRESGRQECDSRDSRRVAATCDGRMPSFVSRAFAMRFAQRAVAACVAVADCFADAEHALAACSDLSVVAEHAVVCPDLSVAAAVRVPVVCSDLSAVADAPVVCPDLSVVQDGLAYCPAGPAVRVPEQEFRGPKPKLLH